jgi:hypothetical protein
MKFILSFKTPDVLDAALEEHNDDCDAIEQTAEKFIKYGECISIEFDTEEGTATVLPV